MSDDAHRFGTCPRCKQEQKVLTWFIACVKGTDRIVSGYVCYDCFNEMERKEREQNAEIRQGNS